MKKNILVAIISLGLCGGVYADCIDPERANGRSRFKSFEPNYFVYRWSDSDDAALRAHFSVKYLTCKYENNAPLNFLNDTEIFFSYTGEFDYYARTRPSGPVINRINNPAIHFRKSVDLGAIDWIDFSIEHKSNGQSVEVISPREIERAEIAFKNSDFRFFDAVSRGSNYAALEAQFSNDLFVAYAKIKIYATTDTDITWGSQKNKNITIADYDRFTAVIRKSIGDSEISLDWTLGDKLLKTDSWNVDYLISKHWPIPLYFRAHYGPLYTLSNYTRSEGFLGIGVKLYPN